MIAVLCSDVHLSHKPPVFRSNEPDWYEAMDRSLEQLRWLQNYFSAPVVIAGDLFHKWNAPAELINFAMRALPDVVYAIPGQHDLPNHDLESIDRSAYWTLVAAGRIHNLTPGTLAVHDDGLAMYGFPWGVPLKPPAISESDGILLAVVHRFLWKRGYGYEGADERYLVSATKGLLNGYHAAVFGDNHQGFLAPAIDTINTGTLMRRAANEINYSPQVGLLLDDGVILRMELDVREDKHIDLQQALEMVETTIDMTEFVGALAGLYSDALDFGNAVERFLTQNGIADRVRTRVMEAINGGSESS